MTMFTRAFTLVEMLVAIAVFVGVMLVATMAVNDFSRAGREADQVLALHARHAAIARDLDTRLGRAAGFAALYLKQDLDGQGELVWMQGLGEKVYTRDLDSLYHRETAAFRTGWFRPFYGNTKMVWASLAWGDGVLRLGQSRRQTYLADRNDSILRRQDEIGLSHTRPTPQERIVHLIGREAGDPAPGEGARLGPLFQWGGWGYTTLGPFNDRDGDGERRDEYDNWLLLVRTRGFFGITNEEPETFAVLNPDGLGANKDWMFLAGTDDPNDSYSDLRLPFDRGIEFIEVTPYDRRGLQISTELDSLVDASDSRDWRGVPRYGRLDLADWNETTQSYDAFDLDRRPARLHFRWLLHAIPMQVLDEVDLDDDGVVNESLADGIRGKVLADATLITLAERREAFRDLVIGEGYAAVIFDHVVEVEL